MNIDYNAGRFSVACTPNTSGPVRRVPGIRWNAAKRVWTCAPTRLAIAAIREDLIGRCGAVATPTALTQLEDVPVVISRFPWPSNYPWKTQPYQHQRDACAFAFGMQSAALHMEQGTGKTKTICDLFGAYAINNVALCMLVICPVSVRRTWQRELATHCPVDVDVLVLQTGAAGKKQLQDHLGGPERPRALIVGAESLQQGGAAVLALEWVKGAPGNIFAVVDESHLIKNADSNRTKEATRLLRSAAYRITMTGTPTGNHLLDLFAQYNALDPNIFGLSTFWSFRERYAIMGGYEGREVIGMQNVEELTNAIRPYTFTVSKADCLDLPPKVYERRYVQLNSDQSRTYKELTKSGSTGELTITMVLERMLRQSQIIAGFYNVADGVYEVSSRVPPKIVELLAIADSTEESIIVWTRHRWELAVAAAYLRREYGDDAVVEVHGDINQDERTAAVDAIQSKRARFLVGTASAGGTGLTLTAATIMVYLSNDFSYISRSQSEDRFHRIGQTKSVTIIDIVAEDTIDEDVLEALSGKKDVAAWLKEQARK